MTNHEIKGSFRRVRRGEQGEEGPFEIFISGGVADVDPHSPDAPVHRFTNAEGRKMVVHGGLPDRPLPEPVVDEEGNCTGQAIPTPADEGEA